MQASSGLLSALLLRVHSWHAAVVTFVYANHL